MAYFGPPPPDVTLALAHEEATHFGLSMEHRLGEFVIAASIRPDVVAALEQYQPPEQVQEDDIAFARHMFTAKGEGMNAEALGALYTVDKDTVGRWLRTFYDKYGLCNEGDATRFLLEREVLTSVVDTADNPGPLSSRAHLVGILMSHGWTRGSIEKRVDRPKWDSPRAALKARFGSSAAGVVAGLHTSGLLVPIAGLHAAWKQAHTSTTPA